MWKVKILFRDESFHFSSFIISSLGTFLKVNIINKLLYNYNYIII